MAIEKQETIHRHGVLLVITGRSGAGKDTVFSKVIETNLHNLNFTQVVTNATREKRRGEVHGKDYYFISEEELFEMHKNGELVEDPVSTGTSYKGTSKKELEKVLEGKNLVWRIDIKRAAEVATGEFFKQVFQDETADILFKRTRVVYIDVDNATLENRRKIRDGENYNPDEYKERDRLENELIGMHIDKFKHVIQNLDNKLDETVKQLGYIIESLSLDQLK